MDTICFVPNTVQQINEIKSFGLKSEWLREVGMKALSAHNQTTSHDATTASGSYAYFAAVRALRDILCVKGWKQTVVNNVEMVTHPELDVYIMVSSGNRDTGNENATPKTKNRKGNQTKKFVSLNNWQMRLPTMERSVANISLNRVWMLLFHIDTSKSQMRMELSLPVEMDLDGLRVSAWNRRIVIEPIDFSHTPDLNALDQDFSPELNIEIERKSDGQ